MFIIYSKKSHFETDRLNTTHRVTEVLWTPEWKGAEDINTEASK